MADTARAPAGAWPVTVWWQRYHDRQLDQLMAEALREAPDMALAAARLRQAQAQAVQADAALLPVVSANADYASVRQSYRNGAPAYAVPQGWNDTARATLDFDYELDFWGRNRAGLQAALTAAEAAKAEAAQARLVLTTAVAAAYADLVQQYADHDAAAEALQIREQSLELFSQRQRNGLENVGTVKQAQALTATARGELAALEEAMALTRNRIAALLGQGPDRGRTIRRPDVALNQNFALPPDLPMALLGHRPDVQAARLQAESAAARVRMAKAGFYPNVNITGYIGQQVLGLQYLGTSAATIGAVGPAINLPIFSRQILDGRYREAGAAYEAAVAAYDAALTRAFQDVGDVAVSRRALEARLAYAQQALIDAETARDMAQQRYKAGLSNYLAVLTAEDTLVQNRRTLAGLQARALILDVQLVRALGGGYDAGADAVTTAAMAKQN